MLVAMGIPVMTNHSEHAEGFGDTLELARLAHPIALEAGLTPTSSSMMGEFANAWH